MTRSVARLPELHMGGCQESSQKTDRRHKREPMNQHVVL